MTDKEQTIANLNKLKTFHNGSYGADINRAIKSLEQEPCDDAISRQAVQDYIAKYLSQYLYNDVREAVEVIDEYIGELPSVNPQSKTGHWIRQDNTKKPLYGWYFCSECNSVIGDKPKFCSNCGAKMVEKGDQDEYIKY